MLTTLLGTHPPRLPAQALVAVGDLFGVTPGTVRTALSRLAADGELVAIDGGYELSATFAARQRALDAGRRSHHEPWDGSWWAAVVLSERRPLSDRRLFRTAMANALMGELRPDVWLRPANLPLTLSDADILVTRGSLGIDAGRDLAGSLWDLRGLSVSLGQLVDESMRAVGLHASSDPAMLAESFMVCVAVVRALASEPQLPSELVGDDWPADELRRCYEELEGLHGRTLRRFLREHSLRSSPDTELDHGNQKV